MLRAEPTLPSIPAVETEGSYGTDKRETRAQNQTSESTGGTTLEEEAAPQFGSDPVAVRRTLSLFAVPIPTRRLGADCLSQLVGSLIEFGAKRSHVFGDRRFHLLKLFAAGLLQFS